jgi:hypothetical protein
MPFAPFFQEFPEIAVKETRVLTVINSPDLPPDEYGLLELYCDDPGCDCRRVIFNIHRPDRQQPDAVIAFGWESDEFYRNWLNGTPVDIHELQGPVLNLASHQSPLAPTLLEQVTLILQDPQYVERLKRHYAQFRAALPEATGKRRDRKRVRKRSRKIRR